METFMDQLWVVLMSAFVVLGILATMVCSVCLVKVFAEKFFSKHKLKEDEDNLLRSFKY